MATEIKIGVGFEFDKNSLSEIQTALQKIQKMSKSEFAKANLSLSQNTTKDLINLQNQAKNVEKAFKAAFNPHLNKLNLSTFQRQLRLVNIDAKQLDNLFKYAGASGVNAIYQMNRAFASSRKELKETKTLIDKMGQTLGNTVKWNIASAAINQVSGSVQEAYGYVKALDHSLNDIRIVTGKSAEEMDIFAEKANNAAKALGTSTTNYTKSALTFYQQGLDDKDVQARAELSNKVSNVTGLSGDQSAEYVTAVLNGYKVGSEEAEHAMDKLAAVAASTASDLAELSEGMSKVASAANAMGVTEDQLAATLSTVVSTTRQSASSVGTAFKTIYARIADIKAGAEGAEVSLGEYSGKMAELGFNVLDSSGQLKDLGTVMEEIGGQWANLSREQQVSLAKTMAGTRQYNNLIALFDNWSDYVDALNVSLNSNGAIQEQQNVYMESTAAHLKQLKASSEDLFDSFLDADTINLGADALKGVIEVLTSLIDSLGGGGEALLAFGAIATRVFKEQIGSSVAASVNKKLDYEYEQKLQLENMQKGENNPNNPLLKHNALFSKYESNMSDKQKDRHNKAFTELSDHAAIKEQLEQEENNAQQYLDFITQKNKSKTIKGLQTDVFNTNLSDSDLSDKKDQNATVLQKIAQEYEEQIDLFDELADNLDIVNESTKEVTEQYKKGNYHADKNTQDTRSNKQKILNSLDGLTFDPDAETQKVKEQIAQNIKTKLNSGALTQEDIEQIKQEYKTLTDDMVQQGNKVTDAQQANIEKQKENEEKRIQELDEYIEHIYDGARMGEATQTFSNLAGSIGQMASAATTFHNLGNIWSNENLSAGEKALQTIEALTFALPMLISGYSGLRKSLAEIPEALDVITAAMDRRLTKKFANTAAEVVNKEATEAGAKADMKAAKAAKIKAEAVEEDTKELNQNTDAEVFNQNSGQAKDFFNFKMPKLKGSTKNHLTHILGLVQKFIPYLGLIVAALGAIGAAVYAINKIWNKNAEAVKAAQENVDNLAKRYQAINSELEKFNHLHESYKNAQNALQGLTKGTDEYKTKLEEANKNAKELIETYELFDSYSVDKDGLITIDKGALSKAQQVKELDAKKAEGRLASSKRALADAEITREKEKYYRDNVNIYKEASINNDGPNGDNYNKLEDILTIQEKSTNNLLEYYKQASSDGVFNKDSFEQLLIENGYTKDEAEKLAEEENTKALQELTGAIDSKNSEKEYYDKQILSSSLADRYQNELSGLSQEQNNQVTNALTGILYNKDGQYQKTLDNIDTIDVQSNHKLNVELSKIKSDISIENDEALAKIYAKIVEGYSDADINKMDYKGHMGKGSLSLNGEDIFTEKSDEAMRSAIYQQIATQKAAENVSGGDDAVKILTELAEKNTIIADGLLEALGNGDTKKLDFSNFLSNLSPEKVDMMKNLSSEDLSKMLGLDESDLQDLGFKSAKAFQKAWNAGLEEYDSSAWVQNVINTSDTVISQYHAVWDDFYKGDLTAQSESYQALKESISGLADQYPELLDDIQTVNNEAIIGTAEWANSLHNIKNKMADIKLDAMITDFNKLNEKLQNFKINDDSLKEFQSTLNELLDKQYAINIEIHSQAEDIFKETEDAMKNIEAEASKIGENFIVSADDLYELNKAIPGILEGRQQLADGTIQLNQQVVQSSIETAQAEVANSRDEAIEELQIKKQALMANAAVYRNIQKIMLNDKLSNTKKQEKIRKKLDEIKDVSSKNEEKINQYIAESGSEAAKVIGENFGKAYELAAENAVKFAQTAVKAHKMAKSGKGKISKPKMNTTFKGNKYDEPEREDLEDIIENADTNNEWQEASDKIDAILDGIAGSVGDIDGMIAELQAVGNSIGHNLGNIGAGKGSGKGGSSNDPDHMDALDETIDKFHDINQQIKRLEHNLSQLNKEEKKLTGKDLLNNLEEQLRVLEEQKKAYKDKIKLIQEEADKLRGSLSSKGVLFDENGYVSNYTEILESKLKNINNLIAQYNGMSAEEQKQFKDTINIAKKSYEQFKKQLNEYNKMIEDELPATQDKLQEQIDKQVEIQIQKFDLSIQVKLDFSTAERQWNEFRHKMRDDLDDHNSSATAEWKYKDILSYYNANGTGSGSIQAQSEHIQTILSELKKMDSGQWSDIYGNDKKHAEDDLKKYYESLMKDLTAVKDLEKAVKDEFLKSIDAVEGAFDSQRDAYHFLEDQLTHDMQLMELLYGKEAYDKMSGYYDKQLQGTKDMLAAEQKTRDYWKEKMLAERAKVDAGTGSKEALAKYEANWKKSIGNINKLIEDWANQTTAKYENTIREIINELNTEITNGLGLDYVNEELTLVNKNAKNYLDNINAAYAKQKLSNKWKDAIDNTDSIYAQQELNKLMEEQNKMLEEKGKLTQYDIDRAEKEYEIALKQIALQEAQQNKSTMRLKRDANGNYSYQFVSDEDEVRKAQDELAAAQNNLYNFDKEAYNNNLNETYATWNEFQQKIAEVNIKYANDEEARQQHLQLLKEEYGERLNFLTEQNLSIRGNLADSAFSQLSNLYNIDIAEFQNMTKTEQDLIIQELVPQWDSGVQQMIDKMVAEGGFEPVCSEAFEKLGTAANNYQKDVIEIQKTNKEVSDEAKEQGEILLQQSKDLTEAMKDEMIRIGEVMTEVEKLKTAYLNAKNAAIEATTAAYNYIQAADKLMRKKAEVANYHPPKTSPSSSHYSSFNSKSGSSGNGYYSGTVVVNTGESNKKDKNDNKNNKNSFVSRPSVIYPPGGYPGGSSSKVPVFNTGPGVFNGSQAQADWRKQHKKRTFDTGGYTGDWGSDGRWALLHEKELVLNQKDTKNVLETVNIAKNIMQTIQDKTLNRVNSLTGHLRNEIKPTSPKEVLEQHVLINAKFEGQTEAHQITAALDNLINIAAQRSNQHKK